MRNYKMDRMRIWASVLVVLIHVTAFLPRANRETINNYYWYRPILNMGVPYFFGVSGYLLQRKSEDYFKKYAKKMGTMFLIYSIFYVLVDIIIVWLTRHDFLFAIREWFKNLSWSTILNGTWGQFHLWYLFALMMGSFLLGWLIQKKIPVRWIFLVALVINGIYWVTPSIPWVEDIFLYGGVLKALLYISLGYYLAETKPVYIFKGWQIILLAVIFSWVYNFAEYGFLSDMMLLMITYGWLSNVFYDPSQYTLLNEWSEYSLDIYVMHVFFLKIIQTYGEGTIWTWIQHDVVYTIIVSLICIFGSVLVYPVFKKMIFDPLDRLFP